MDTLTENITPAEMTNAKYNWRTARGGAWSMLDITLPDMKWTDLGVQFPGTTQVILFDFDAIKDYNKKVFNLYKKKKI